MSRTTNNIAPLIGEKPIENAPLATLSNGKMCVPQHYLIYQHDLASVEELLLRVHYSDRYPVFVCEDNSGFYLQVGIIGFDNYLPLSEQQKSKIVYGRKWRIEPRLPTSEIIQTALLAIKKAREHEIRELFRFKIENKVTTPFNNHHDLPMMRLHQQQLLEEQVKDCPKELAKCIDQITYDGSKFSLFQVEKRSSDRWLVELKVEKTSQSTLDELNDGEIVTLVLPVLSFNLLCHHLMQQLINLSDRQVDEIFSFDGYKRFSWSNNVESIARLSANTRQLHKSESKIDFEHHWQQTNYETDLTRAPTLSRSSLSQKLINLLASFEPLAGILPNNYQPQS